jgi:putative CocE/NonD family hydrolase
MNGTTSKHPSIAAAAALLALLATATAPAQDPAAREQPRPDSRRERTSAAPQRPRQDPARTGASLPDLARGGSDIVEDFRDADAGFDFERSEVMIPMRDGVKLFTVLVRPRKLDGPAPIVLTRTPYDADEETSRAASPRGVMILPADDEPLLRNGYIRAYQDVRGIHGSEGDYVMTLPPRGPLNSSDVDHSTDTWDTIEWLVKNVPGNNGKVGITGVSYDGFLTLMALLDPHPALAAAAPMNAMVEGWIGDDWYHNGALRQTMIEYVYAQTSSKDADRALPFGYHDLYQAFLDAGSAAAVARRYGVDRLPAWRRLVENPAYTDFWRLQAVDKMLAEVERTVPTLHVHGLFDQEDIYGPLLAYQALEEKDRRNDRNVLVIGPWHHGQQTGEASSLGPLRWGSDTGLWFREQVLQRFWDQHLKGIEPASKLSPVYAFETGRNRWLELEAWPPPGVVPRKLHLLAEGGLGFTPPRTAETSAPAGRAGNSGAGGAGPAASRAGADPADAAPAGVEAADADYTEYVSDPRKPVPYRAPPVRPLWSDDSTWRQWLVDDQRPPATRADVLVFSTEPLEEPLTVSGEVVANLFASVTGTDADFVVKLIDVYPPEVRSQPELGGYQLMISADIFRGRYHAGFEKAEPLPPNHVVELRFRLPHANHTFLPGHRVMVQVQSSWFPLYDRNPQTFVDNVAEARPEDYRAAIHRVHHSPAAASFLELPVRQPAQARPVSRGRR